MFRLHRIPLLFSYIICIENALKDNRNNIFTEKAGGYNLREGKIVKIQKISIDSWQFIKLLSLDIKSLK